ncbi:MAG: propionate CoA-transferase [Baekduia sp.]|nr:propionate CoA-transferase [Baekduia sp.]
MSDAFDAAPRLPVSAERGRAKVMTAGAAVALVPNGATLATGGFVGIGVPEELLVALERRFLDTGAPRDLNLLYAGGQGDGNRRGLNHLGHPDLVRRVVGGHWGLTPALGRLALEGSIEAYCLPQGVISRLYRETAAGGPGVITKVGLGTFVDPRLEGGRLNERTTDDVVRLLELDGEEYLFYPRMPVAVAFLRGTTADLAGNITMEREAVTLEALSIAQAAHNSGGIVIVQVERVVERHTLSPREVQIPDILVDAVVIADPANHPQTFAESYNPSYTGEGRRCDATPPMDLDERKVIARRALLEMEPRSVVNLGIGMPEGIVGVAEEEGLLSLFTATVEAGGIGGRPAGGQSFGATSDATAIVDQPYQFDFYDGGGLDQAFLGLAEVDRDGNVNVSRFGSRLPGAGGFINISQSTRALYFMGTFGVGARSEVRGDALRVIEPGRPKFVARVGQITFSAAQARARGQRVLYITERCVLRLGPVGLELIEIAPGLDLEADILAHMGFRPTIAPDLCQMDPLLFGAGRMAPADSERRPRAS